MSLELPLSIALSKLADAINRNSEVLEILIEGMRPEVEAKITGVSTRTVARRRKARRLQRLIDGR